MEIVLGTLVAGLVQWIKTKYKTTEYGTLLVVAGLALVASLGYSLFTYLGYWDIFYNVVLRAGAIYVFIFKRFEQTSPVPSV